VNFLEILVEYIQQNIFFAPFIIFTLLLLAGFNLPVSEDAMIFLGAVLAAQHPQMLYVFMAAVFFGAYLSDIIAYWLGRLLGPRIFENRFLKKMVTQEKFRQVNRFYARYGITTLIVGRFIPFGVRNALFITAGLGRMNFIAFAIADLIACILTTSIFFSLYYNYGEEVIDQVKKFGLYSFMAVAVVVVLILLYRRFKPSASKAS
jgi:membrane-associated protein